MYFITRVRPSKVGVTKTKYDDYRDLRETSRLKGKEVGWMSLTVACNRYNVKQKCDSRTLCIAANRAEICVKVGKSGDLDH
jgi:hypothetical protein